MWVCTPFPPGPCFDPSWLTSVCPLPPFSPVRSPPSLTFLHTPPLYDDHAAVTADFIVVPSTATLTTLFPRVIDAQSGALLWSLPPTQRPLLQLTGLSPGVTYTLSVGCVDAVGNACVQNLTYTWGTAACPTPGLDTVTNLRSQSIQPGMRAFAWTPVPLAAAYEYALDSAGSAGLWTPVPSWASASQPMLMVSVAQCSSQQHMHTVVGGPLP